MRGAWLSTVWLAACATEPGPALDECAAGGATLAFLMSEVVFVGSEDGVSEGFDIDERTSDEYDDLGCEIEDYTSPDGTPGIDNAFAQILPYLSLTEAVALEPLIADAIQSGQLMLVVELSGVDDEVDDACVDMDILRGSGTPLVGTDDVVVAGQTVERDPDGPVSGSADVPLVDGAVTARPVDVAVSFQVLDAAIDFELLQGAIRIQINADGTATGLFAGGLDVASLVHFTQGAGIDDGLVATLEVLLGEAADLEPDETGACQQISVTLAFEAVPVWIFE